jgi:hypothetical protein
MFDHENTEREQEDKENVSGREELVSSILIRKALNF